MAGWDDLEMQARDPRPGRDASDIDRLFAQVFKTDAGAAVLKYLREMTIEQPSWVPGQDASYGYVAEGQKSIVREIERRVKKTENK